MLVSNFAVQSVAHAQWNQKRFYGLVCGAATKHNHQLRADLHQSLSVFLTRLVLRAKHQQRVTLCPTIEARKWSTEGQRQVTARTIQRWVNRLVDLKLIDVLRYGTCNVVRFKFKVRQLSAHTFTGEGESPTEIPPSVDKSPAGGGAVGRLPPSVPRRHGPLGLREGPPRAVSSTT